MPKPHGPKGAALGTAPVNPPTLTALRAWSQQAEALLICGVERSGTSALQLTLARHAALFHIRDVFETFVFARPDVALKEPVPQMTISYLRGRAQLERLQQLAGRMDLAAPADGSEPAPALAPTDAAERALDQIRLFFWFAAHEIYAGRQVLEKTPSHVRSLGRIFSVFPRARVLVCTREPVEIIASYRKRMAREQSLGKTRDQWGWLDKSPQALMAYFAQVSQAVEAARQTHPGQLFTVPYHWLTGDPEAALRALCAFAHLPFEPTLLSRETAKDRPVDPLLSQPLMRNEADVSAHLDAATIAQIEVQMQAQTAGLATWWSVPGTGL
jgi:hypothetical protein